MSKATEIRQRLLIANAPFGASDNISAFINPGDLDLLQEELTTKFQEVLDTLLVDTDNDPNSKDTARRVAKMYLNETYAGRYFPAPSLTEFPNTRELDEIYTVGPIHINSLCSHHMVPIIGDLWVGVHPGENVIGLSKFHRLAIWLWSRGHIQEDSTVKFAKDLFELIKPKGLAVVLKASHMCVSCRGVKDNNTVMTTSVVLGTMRDSISMKEEFFRLITL